MRDETGIHVTAENAKVAEGAEVILIGVKPVVVLPVLHEIAALIENKLVISLAAGVRLQNMKSISTARLMRAMTNTPTAIGRGATALVRGDLTSADDFACARKLFDTIGVTVEVNEDHIDAVTALAGSGPAFVYSVIEALAQGGAKSGLPLEIASALATHTVLGAAQLAVETGKSPEELRRMVVTPGGTTAAGLSAMEELKTSEGLIAAVQAATKRGREIAAETIA